MRCFLQNLCVALFARAVLSLYLPNDNHGPTGIHDAEAETSSTAIQHAQQEGFAAAPDQAPFVLEYNPFKALLKFVLPCTHCSSAHSNVLRNTIFTLEVLPSDEDPTNCPTSDVPTLRLNGEDLHTEQAPGLKHHGSSGFYLGNITTAHYREYSASWTRQCFTGHNPGENLYTLNWHLDGVRPDDSVGFTVSYLRKSLPELVKWSPFSLEVPESIKNTDHERSPPLLPSVLTPTPVTTVISIQTTYVSHVQDATLISISSAPVQTHRAAAEALSLVAEQDASSETLSVSSSVDAGPHEGQHENDADVWQAKTSSIEVWRDSLPAATHVPEAVLNMETNPPGLGKHGPCLDHIKHNVQSVLGKAKFLLQSVGQSLLSTQSSAAPKVLASKAPRQRQAAPSWTSGTDHETPMQPEEVFHDELDEPSSSRPDDEDDADDEYATPPDQLYSVFDHEVAAPTHTMLPSPTWSPQSKINLVRWLMLLALFIALASACFHYVRNNPRLRAELAARCEERRNRRLYNQAARRERWLRFWRRFRHDSCPHQLYEKAAAEWQERRRENLEDDRRGAVSMPTMSDEISAMRKAHRVVDGIIQAEEGRLRQKMISLDRRKRRIQRARRSSWSGSEKSEPGAPPPYEECEGEDEIIVDGMGHWYGPEDFSVSGEVSPVSATFSRRGGGGAAYSERSSVISTSPRTSLYCGSDSEKE